MLNHQARAGEWYGIARRQASKQAVPGWMDGWIAGMLDGWMAGRLDGWMDGRLDGWLVGW